MAHPALTSRQPRSARAFIRRIVRELRALLSLMLLIVVPFGAASAQSAATLSGRVLISGVPAADVAVFLAGTTRGAQTGTDGRYRIAGIAAGQYTVVAQRIGAATIRQPLAIAEGQQATLDFTLEAAATTVAPMSVIATRELRRRDEGSATIDMIDGAEVRRSLSSHPSGLMNRLAGVHVSDLSGEGHSMAIRQPITTKPMYLYLEDGIPTRATGFFNHNALYEVNIPQSGGVEVLKGPGTALYGSDAIGGVVNVLTRAAPLAPSLDASLEGGAFGYARLLASGGFTSGANGFRADVNVTRSSNWKDNAPFRRESGTLRWEHAGAAGWHARTVITGSAINQQDVPALNAAQFDSSRTLNLAPIAYRRVKALRVSSALELDRGASLWSVTPYARYNDMELLPSWQLSFDPQTWVTQNRSVGVLTKYRHRIAPMAASAIVGMDAEVSPGSFFAQRAVVTRTGADRAYTSFTAGGTHYDYDVTYRVASPYLHVEATPLQSLTGGVLRTLRVDAGLRADFSGYSYDTRLAPVDSGAHRVPASTTRSYSHLSPKVGATIALAPEASLFGSYRHGFRAPSQGQLFQQNSAANTVDLSPVKVDAYELGLRGQLGVRAGYQLSAYDMTIRDDIITYVTGANTREARNAGRTRHRGVELSTGLAVTSEVRLDASYSVSRQYYVEWTPQAARGTVAEISFSGNRIESAPRDLGNLFLSWAPAALHGGRAAVEWTHTGSYATDAANTNRYGGYALINLHGSATVVGRTELFGRITNLLDRSYAELVTYDAFQRDQFTPGAPRSVFVGVRSAW